VSTHLPRLSPLPEGFAETRVSLHRLAGLVIAPARKAASGRIGLRPEPGVFGTPLFGDDEQLQVEAGPGGNALLVRRSGNAEKALDITSLQAAADFAGVSLTADPGIGHDPPPLGDTAAPLPISAAATEALGEWFDFSNTVLAALKGELDAAGHECSEIQLWPEHFDLGCSIDGVNFGCSPGDGYADEPYVYVGLWNTEGLPDGGFWNTPFGAALRYGDLLGAGDQLSTALDFLRRGADLALERRVSTSD
jgi:hypothetical protein